MRITLKAGAESPAPMAADAERATVPKEETHTSVEIVTDLDACVPDAFFKWYPQESHPQPVRLELDAQGLVAVYVDDVIGTREPEPVGNGRTRRWTLPSGILPAEVQRLLEEAMPLLARVHAGHSVAWDSHDHIGRLTDDALHAEYDLDLMIRNRNWQCLQAWHVHDYLARWNDTGDVNTLLAEAVANGLYIIGGRDAVAEYVRGHGVSAARKFRAAPSQARTCWRCDRDMTHCPVCGAERCVDAGCANNCACRG